MKINLGSGNNKMEGYENIDAHHPEADVIWDLNEFPWYMADSSVEAVHANHVLEHLNDLCAVMAEIYRISKHGAVIQINVPAPSHDNFTGDPTHVTAVTPEAMSLFSKKNCAIFKEKNAANSPLADYLDCDFEMQHLEYVLDPAYEGWKDDPGISTMMRQYRNVVSEFRMTMKVIKENENE